MDSCLRTSERASFTIFAVAVNAKIPNVLNQNRRLLKTQLLVDIAENIEIIVLPHWLQQTHKPFIALKKLT